MSKKLTTLSLVMALALVLVSGNYFSARAEGGFSFGCWPDLSFFCLSCPSPSKDADRPGEVKFKVYKHGAAGNGYDYGEGGGNLFGGDYATNSLSIH